MRKLLLLLTLSIPFGGVAVAYSPEDPIVVEMVDRAAAYLEQVEPGVLSQAVWGGGEYHQVICGYAHYKAMQDGSSRLVNAGIEKARQLASSIRARKGDLMKAASGSNKSTYEAAVSIMLLAEVDPKAYRYDLETLRDALLARQMPNGAFGYYGQTAGDISQIQYVVLAIWTLDRVGIEVDDETVAKTFAYLMRVQDPNGAWPYLATDPAPRTGLVSQSRRYMSHSTSLAGAGSILIAADYFGLWGRGRSRDAAIPGLPKAVKAKLDEVPRAKRDSPVDRAAILNSVKRMNGYRKKNVYKRDAPHIWHYYSLYSMERFESFFEFATGTRSLEQDWYNEGVEQLRAEQSPAGNWTSFDYTTSPPPVATAFAILFLVRSTQRSIAQPSSGAARGGRDFPKDTTNIRVEDGSIKARHFEVDLDSLLEAFEKDGGDDLEGKTLPDDLELDLDPVVRAAQLDRLERLVRGSRSWRARRVAARLLGQSDELRVVPALIFALGDPDWSVKQYARDGLRFVSRRFEGYGLTAKPSDAQTRRAQQEWRDWYLSVTPGHVFLDYEY